MTEKDAGEQDIFTFYEVVSYFCPEKPFHRCEQEAPGTDRHGGAQLRVSKTNRSAMQQYYDAFEQAKVGAPRCSVHFLDMIPVVSEVQKDDKPPLISSN